MKKANMIKLGLFVCLSFSFIKAAHPSFFGDFFFKSERKIFDLSDFDSYMAILDGDNFYPTPEPKTNDEHPSLSQLPALHSSQLSSSFKEQSLENSLPSSQLMQIPSSQLVPLNQRIQQQRKILITHLPLDILRIIIKYFDDETIFNLSKTSRLWRQLTAEMEQYEVKERFIFNSSLHKKIALPLNINTPQSFNLTLKCMTISNQSFFHSTIFLIMRLPNLKELHITNCYIMNNEINVLANALELNYWPNLKTLNLSHTSLGIKSELIMLALVKNSGMMLDSLILKKAALNLVALLTLEIYLKTYQAKNLKTLNLNNNFCTAEEVSTLGKILEQNLFSCLENLGLRMESAGHDNYNYIAKKLRKSFIPNLKKLHFSGTQNLCYEPFKQLAMALNQGNYKNLQKIILNGFTTESSYMMEFLKALESQNQSKQLISLSMEDNNGNNPLFEKILSMFENNLFEKLQILNLRSNRATQTATHALIAFVISHAPKALKALFLRGNDFSNEDEDCLKAYFLKIDGKFDSTPFLGLNFD